MEGVSPRAKEKEAAGGQWNHQKSCVVPQSRGAGGGHRASSGGGGERHRGAEGRMRARRGEHVGVPRGTTVAGSLSEHRKDRWGEMETEKAAVHSGSRNPSRKGEAEETRVKVTLKITCK